MVTYFKKLTISKIIVEQVKSVFLRGLTILLKFALIVYLQKEGSLQLLGQFNLYSTTILLGVFVIGFDYYTYSNRLTIQAEANGKINAIVLIRQFHFYFLSFSLISILCFCVYQFGAESLTSSYSFVLFILILLFEHLSQEVFRLYIALQKPSFANLLMFVRGGVWILIFIVSDQFLGFHDKLSALLYFWVLSVSISTVIGLTKLSTRFDLVKNIAQYDFSLLPIYRGVMVALPFFCTTIMYKLMEFFNRYVIKSSFGHEDVGIFSFYSMLASLSIIVSDILVFSFLYPQLIQATHTRNQELYTKTIKNMTIQSSTLFVVTSISTFIFIYFFGEFFIDIKIVSNINILIILLLSNFFLILSLTPNYIIYANGKDYLILKGTLLGFCCNILGSLLVIPLYGINGAAYVQLLSFFVLFCSKKYMLKKIPQNIN